MLLIATIALNECALTQHFINMSNTSSTLQRPIYLKRYKHNSAENVIVLERSSKINRIYRVASPNPHFVLFTHRTSDRPNFLRIAFAT
jgi:hypothetical protein